MDITCCDVQEAVLGENTCFVLFYFSELLVIPLKYTRNQSLC